MSGMRGIGVALALALLGMAACDVDGPTGLPDDSANEAAVSGIGGVEPAVDVVQGPRPLTGAIAGIGVVGAACSASPPGAIITATAHGNVSHLGATTLVQNACISLVDFTPLGPSDVTLTAANGDELAGWVTGLVFNADGFDMQVTILSGTGRFSQAAGVYAVHVIQAAPLTPFTASIEGWVRY